MTSADDIRHLIGTRDLAGLENALSKDPSLANAGIPCDEANTTPAHPLNRLCDGVFSGTYTDEEAVAMAKIFLAHGAKVEGNNPRETKDTPLVAAASLHADKVAMLYMDHGANIHHAGCSGGTALHWACWCGRDSLVKRLIAEKADIHKICIEHRGTPLLWAVHGYKFGGEKNRLNQIDCVRMLLQAGANKNVPNILGEQAIEFLDEADVELMDLLSDKP
jgi:ankyrin repeat protein